MKRFGALLLLFGLSLALPGCEKPKDKAADDTKKAVDDKKPADDSKAADDKKAADDATKKPGDAGK